MLGHTNFYLFYLPLRLIVSSSPNWQSNVKITEQRKNEKKKYYKQPRIELYNLIIERL